MFVAFLVKLLFLKKNHFHGYKHSPVAFMNILSHAKHP